MRRDRENQLVPGCRRARDPDLDPVRAFHTGQRHRPRRTNRPDRRQHQTAHTQTSQKNPCTIGGVHRRNKSGRDDKGGTSRKLPTPPDLADPLPTRFRPLAWPNDNHVCWAKPRMADDARVRPPPLTVQAAYADLLARLQEDAVLELGGTPVLRRRGAREYWYSAQRLAGRSAERYSGPDSPEVRERVERARRVNEDLKERARQRARCPRPPAAVSRLSDPRPGAGGDPLPVGSPRQRPRSRPLRDPQAHRRHPVRALRGSQGAEGHRAIGRPDPRARGGSPGRAGGRVRRGAGPRAGVAGGRGPGRAAAAAGGQGVRGGGMNPGDRLPLSGRQRIERHFRVFGYLEHMVDHDTHRIAAR